MGISFQKRGRLENLVTDNPYIAYAMGRIDRDWAHVDYEIIADEIKKQYEKANKNLQRGFT